MLSDATIAELLATAMAAVEQEYPHKLDQELNSDSDLQPPRVLNPSFFGSYDWHSAVHSHWTIARCLRRSLPPDLAARAIAVLDDHLTPARLRAEVSFFESAGGRVSERPYGWTWLLLLNAECSSPYHRGAHPWGEALEPLAGLLGARLVEYFTAQLAYPIRTGTHGNSAFSLRLMWKASRLAGDTEMERAVRAVALRFYLEARQLPWDSAPSGTDFLSAPLEEAALMAEVLGPGRFPEWLASVGIGLAKGSWSVPLVSPDDDNFSGSHLEGLLVTRAWSLATIARALAGASPLEAEVRRGLAAHLAQVQLIRASDGFHRAHWLPTFLVFLDDQLDGASR